MKFETCNVQPVSLTIIGQRTLPLVFLVSSLLMIYQFFVTHLKWRMTEDLMQPATELKRVIVLCKVAERACFPYLL